MTVALNRLHYSLPLLVLKLEIESFLCSIFDGTFGWSHFVPSQTCYDPAETLVRQNLYFEADKFYFLSVGKVSVRLVNYAIINSPVDCLKSGSSLQIYFLVKLINKFVL